MGSAEQRLDPEEAVHCLMVMRDYYATIYLDGLYFDYMLKRYKNLNLAFEFIVTIGTASSVIAGWAIWQSRIGAVVWAIISSLSVLLTIVKPLIKLTGSIEKYSKLYTEYARVLAKLKLLDDNIVQANGRVSQQHRELFYELREVTNKLASETIGELDHLGVPISNLKRVQELKEFVDEEIPKLSTMYDATGHFRGFIFSSTKLDLGFSVKLKKLT